VSWAGTLIGAMQEFVFSAPVWIYDGDFAWYFVTLPRRVAAEIREATSGRRKAFGTVKVAVTLGTSRWTTSLFATKELESYVLPLKASVRQREQVQAGMTVEILLVLV
jgi:hypothetical protein